MRNRNRERRRLAIEPLEARQLLAADLIKDVNVLPAGSQIEDSLVSGERIFFSAETAEYGRELWISEGATGQTRMLVDMRPGPDSSNPMDLVEAGGRIFFTAISRMGRRLWVSDGTTAGTKEVGGLGLPHGVVAVGDRVYYLDQNDTAIWVSDGTPDGTHAVEFLKHLAGRFTTILPFGERFFVNIGGETWFSDGTEQGTLKLGSNQASEVLLAGDRAFLYERHAGRLSSSDGTATGTSLLSDNVFDVALIDRRIVYQNELGLWASNGTPQDKTNLVPPDVVDFDYLRTVGANVFALGTRVDGSHELWTTDGTPEGTRLVQVVADQPTVYPKYVHATATHLYFSMNDDFWVSDGTAEGTFAIRPSSPVRYFMAMSNSRAMFIVGTALGSFELWTTDGTSAGTRRIREVFRSARGGHPRLLGATEDGQRMYFVANDGVSGGELWETDGTVAGTQLVADITRDLTFGNELWQITTEPLEGDLDGDGRVGFTDFLVLSAHFNREATPEQGDVDGDGKVDFADFVILANNFGRFA